MSAFRAQVGAALREVLSPLIGGGLPLLGGVVLYLSGSYSLRFAGQLRPVGQLPLLIALLPVLALLAGFFSTVFGARRVLFGDDCPDPGQVLARMTALYLVNLGVGLLVMLPAGAVYLLYGGGGGVRFLADLLAGTALLAPLPALLALAGGYVLGRAARLPRGRLAGLLLYGVLLAVSFRASFLLRDLPGQVPGLQAALHSWGVPFLLLQQAACDESPLSLLLLAALCLGPYVAAGALLARRAGRRASAPPQSRVNTSPSHPAP